MNKPRIKLVKGLGLWHCCIPGSDRSVYCGVGKTPALAYRDWRMWRGGA